MSIANEIDLNNSFKNYLINQFKIQKLDKFKICWIIKLY